MSMLNNPSIADFLAASETDQSAFIDRALPAEKLYAEAGFTILGMYYEGARDRDSEWIDHPEYYDVVGILKNSGQIGSDRLSAIENGAPVNEPELQILRRDYAENDPEGWTALHLWEVALRDGNLFVVFYGHNQGPAGFALEYGRSFETKDEAVAWLESFDLHS